jgi:hypothetical protein
MQIIQNMFICLRAGNNPLNTVNTQTKKIFPPIHRTERQRSRGRHELMRTVSSDLTVREPSPPLLPRWQKPRQHKAPHEFDNDEIAFFPPLSRLGINIWLCREPEAEDVCGRLENGRACWLDTVVVNREKSWSARERNRDVKVNQSNDHRVHIIVGRLGDNLPEAGTVWSWAAALPRPIMGHRGAANGCLTCRWGQLPTAVPHGGRAPAAVTSI